MNRRNVEGMEMTWMGGAAKRWMSDESDPISEKRDRSHTNVATDMVV